jgi:hypothetical protein
MLCENKADGFAFIFLAFKIFSQTKIFRPNREKLQRTGDNYTMRSILVCTVPIILVGWLN